MSSATTAPIATAPVATKPVAKAVVAPKPKFQGKPFTQGDGEANCVFIDYRVCLCLDDLKALMPKHLAGLEFGLKGGADINLGTCHAIGDLGGFRNAGVEFISQEVVKLCVAEATALNPQVALLAELEVAKAKAKAYDELMAKLADDEAKRKEAQAIKTAKMVATKAKQKSETASVASSGGKVEPVADAPVAEAPKAKPVKQVKKAVAPPLTAEEKA